jgi:hypothetical protein
LDRCSAPAARPAGSPVNPPFTRAQSELAPQRGARLRIGDHQPGGGAEGGGKHVVIDARERSGWVESGDEKGFASEDVPDT